MSTTGIAIDRFLSEYVSIESGEIHISERKSEGSGTVKFPSDCPAIVVRNPSDQPPLKWAKNRRCADGAIVVEVEGQVHAHLIELKSTVGPSSWAIIKGQFHGMWQNVISVTAVGGANLPEKVICHLAYKTEKFSVSKVVDPVLLKVALGKGHSISRDEEWHDGRFELDGFGSVTLRKIVRDIDDGSGRGTL